MKYINTFSLAVIITFYDFDDSILVNKIQ